MYKFLISSYIILIYIHLNGSPGRIAYRRIAYPYRVSVYRVSRAYRVSRILRVSRIREYRVSWRIDVSSCV